MSAQTPAEVIVAGHLCLDIIPQIGGAYGGDTGATLQPGVLIRVGPAILATGGAVSNTGIALHRLGLPVSLAGKVGDDVIGRAILDTLRQSGDALADGVIVSPGEASSYSVVINPPNVDRMFLHCPGTNDTYGADDFERVTLQGARLLHFGYPPLMKKIYDDGGEGLASMFARARQAGLTTSLDMARPDPDSEAGRVDWAAFLEKVLPHVNVFLPSVDELLYMLDRPQFDRMESNGGVLEQLTGTLISGLADRLLALGLAVVAIKLGDKGFYLRTTSDRKRLAEMGACAPADAEAWAGRELISPCLKVEVAGTTGSGDCTIAGFLAALVKGLPPEQAVASAVAVGACSVEKAEATGGVPTWEEVQKRLAGDWQRHALAVGLDGWTKTAEETLMSGPHDGPTT